MDWDTRFGAFRQLLHTGVSSPRDRAQLLDLIDDAFHADPDRYLEQWAGYAASLHLDAPVVIECASVSAFLFWSQRAPFARFDVAFDQELRGQAALKTLATSKHLGLIRSLSTSQCRLGPKGAQALADLDGLSRLESLDLSSSYIKDEGFEALVASGLLDGLTRLDVSSCTLDSASAARMADAIDTTSLTTLDLSSNPFGPEGVITIVASCPELRELHVRVTVDYDPCVFLASDLERLVALESLSNLESLHIPLAHLPDTNALDSLCALAEAPHFANLSYLELDGLYGSLDVAGALMLLESGALPALKNLPPEFFRAATTRADCDALLAHPHAQHLTALDVSHAAHPFIDALSESPPLASLRSLTLRDVTELDLDALSNWPGLATVESLDLTDADYDLSDKHLRRLIDSPHARGLRVLRPPTHADLIALPAMLAGSPALDGLEVLPFLHANICDYGRLRAFCASPELASLQHLEMRRCALNAETLDTLCSCVHLTALRTLVVYEPDLEPRHLDALRHTPWFDGLDSLTLFIPFPWDSANDAPLVERARHLIASLADGPLPRHLESLDVAVADPQGGALAPDALLRLIARPELSHAARHALLAPLMKTHLNTLARDAGLKGTTRLKRYPLIEAIRRFVMARDATSA